MTTQKKAAIYARTDHEGDMSSVAYQVQLAECNMYCWSQGYRVDEMHMYQEVYSGAEQTNRQTLTRLCEAARNKAFDVVVVSDFDQLGTTQQQVLFLAEMQKYGIRVESLRGPFVG